MTKQKNGKPSYQGLQAWFLEHWVELVIVGLLLWGAGQFYSLNREIGSLSADISGLKSQIDKADLPALSGFGDLKTRVQEIGTALTELRVKLAEQTGDALWREASRLIGFTQFGQFNENTKLSDEPLTYHWKLEQPVNPKRVLVAVVSPSEPLPGLQVSAEIDSRGNYCLMTVKGTRAESLEKLQRGVGGQMFVVAQASMSDSD